MQSCQHCSIVAADGSCNEALLTLPCWRALSSPMVWATDHGSVAASDWQLLVVMLAKTR